MKEEELAAAHVATYDALAREYEARADALLPVTRASIEWMLPHLSPGGHVLDLGCGAGLGASCLLERGFRVTCLDISAEMAALAKRRNPAATCLQGDYLTTAFKTPFDGIFAFAFIHLFPKALAQAVLKKMWEDLRPSGIVLVGSTVSKESSEGWEVKADYNGEHKRFRKHWTKAEFTDALFAAGFEIVKQEDHTDPFGKVWMDFLVQKS